MDFQTMNKQRKYLLIIAGIGIIAMFLPWIRISIMGIVAGSTNGMHDTGILVFLCFLGCGILAFLGDQSKPLDKTMWMITMVLAGIAAIIMLIWLFRMMDTMSFLSIGFSLALICSFENFSNDLLRYVSKELQSNESCIKIQVRILTKEIIRIHKVTKNH
ncbi:MAG: hypothetical protein EOO01_09225 [Chitinophagaceae bacterium]|nr:MAG: hypothetical protein EOO01_09225 [Chitinophagaceae bacterium]